MEFKQIIYGIIILVVLLGAAIVWMWQTEKASLPLRAELTEVAQCLEQKGALFYGAFWCPVCTAQKESFGTAKTKLPYVECSTPDRSDQLQLCKDEEILAYPTWKFSNAMQCTGQVSVEVLAHLAGCPIPSRGEEVTVEGLYVRLIEEDLKKTLRETGTEEGSDEWETELNNSRERISTKLQELHNTTLEETNDISALLDVIATETEGCELYEPEEEALVELEALELEGEPVEG